MRYNSINKYFGVNKITIMKITSEAFDFWLFLIPVCPVYRGRLPIVPLTACFIETDIAILTPLNFLHFRITTVDSFMQMLLRRGNLYSK